jgi:hypothetical protein
MYADDYRAKDEVCKGEGMKAGKVYRLHSCSALVVLYLIFSYILAFDELNGESLW